MKLDIGCGDHKESGFTGLDSRKLPGVDIVHDIEQIPWPVEDESCEYVRCYHILEHVERRIFFNTDKPCVLSEIHRILEPQGFFHVEFPIAGSTAYYSDPTHVNPLVLFTFLHLDPRGNQWKIYQPEFRFTVEHYHENASASTMEILMRKYE
jgi:predicted SAM-dependent methyltransferase